jgi:kynurenine formamidase
MSDDNLDTDGGDSSTNSPELDRRTLLRSSGALAALATAGVSINGVQAQGDTPPVGDIEELLGDLPDNWGRWGEDDELGALNLLGSEELFDGMKAATKRGRKGVESYTLQLPMTGYEAPEEEVGQDPLFPGRVVGRRDNVADVSNVSPAAGGMKFTDDKFVTTLFLQGTTHLDALAHPWYGDELYNGFDEDTTRTKRDYFNTEMPEFDGQGGVDIIGCDSDEPVEETYGLGKADISSAAQKGVMGRGVLLDVGREMGGNGEGIYDDRLAPNTCVTLEDLKETADAQGVELQERDILLIRTGSIPRAREGPDERDADWNPLNEPGLCFSEELVRWTHDMEIPFYGADNIAMEKLTQVVEQDGEEVTIVNPLHGAFMRDLGVYIAEILWLEDLAAACAEDGIYDFLFAAAPLHVEMSTGAPINPMVIKASAKGRPDDDSGEDEDDDRGKGKGKANDD